MDVVIHVFLHQTVVDYPNFCHAYQLIDLTLKTELFMFLIISYLYFL
jgi:hypothetical protein